MKYKSLTDKYVSIRRPQTKMQIKRTEMGEHMRIEILTNAAVADTEVKISCNRLTPEIEKIISMLRMIDMQLTGIRNGESFLVDATEVLYIETVDKKTFLYTKEEVYETNLHLYELEEQLMETGFFRAAKSCIINFKHIVSMKADIDRKIKVTMSNGEYLMVSRQYAEQIKEKMGVK